MLIRPKEGLKIPVPGTKLFLHAGGQEVAASTYWRRRLQDGDVELVKSEPAPKEKEVSKKEPVKGSK